jgi:hypothetical protein
MLEVSITMFASTTEEKFFQKAKPWRRKTKRTMHSMENTHFDPYIAYRNDSNYW